MPQEASVVIICYSVSNQPGAVFQISIIPHVAEKEDVEMTNVEDVMDVDCEYRQTSTIFLLMAIKGALSTLRLIVRSMTSNLLCLLA